MTFSKLKIAEIFGVDRLTVYRWVSKGCPIVETGAHGKPAKLDFKAVLEWRKDDLSFLGWPVAGIKLMEKQARERLKTLKGNR